MSVFETGVIAGRRAGVGRFAANLDADDRFHDFAGRYGHAGPREAGFFGRIGSALGAFTRLVIPILLLATLGGASFVYAGTPAPVLTQDWLNLGLVLLPLTFLAVHLTSRRYGAGYAVAQVVLTYAVGLSLAFFGRDQVTYVLGQQHAPLREIVGFAAALFAANLVSIFLFDRLRGPQWWQAPLFASLFGGIVLSVIAFPASYLGTNIDWTGRMLDYMALTSIAAVLLIIPYWTLRAIVPPRPGFGGY